GSSGPPSGASSSQSMTSQQLPPSSSGGGSGFYPSSTLYGSQASSPRFSSAASHSAHGFPQNATGSGSVSDHGFVPMPSHQGHSTSHRASSSFDRGDRHSNNGAGNAGADQCMRTIE